MTIYKVKFCLENDTLIEKLFSTKRSATAEARRVSRFSRNTMAYLWSLSSEPSGEFTSAHCTLVMDGEVVRQ